MIMASRCDDRHGGYSAILPDGWTHAREKSSVSFFNSESGSGAINISCYYPPFGVIPDPVRMIQDLHCAMSAPSDGVAILDLPSKMPGRKCLLSEFIAKGVAWRIWVIANDSRAVIITYNCKIDSQGVEDEAVDQFVEGLTLLGEKGDIANSRR
jgi:hypothetical protein